MFLFGRWYTLWACLLRSRKREQCSKLPIHKILSGKTGNKNNAVRQENKNKYWRWKLLKQSFPLFSFRIVCFVCLDILPTWIYMHCASGADGGQKRLSGLLDPEIWMVVSHHLGELNQGPLWERYAPLTTDPSLQSQNYDFSQPRFFSMLWVEATYLPTKQFNEIYGDLKKKRNW